jgi:hypothetical protein
MNPLNVPVDLVPSADGFTWSIWCVELLRVERGRGGGGRLLTTNVSVLQSEI